MSGQGLAFSGMAPPGFGGIFVSPSERSAPTLLARSLGVSPIYMNWAPDSSSIAYLVLKPPSGQAMYHVRLSDPETIRHLGSSLRPYHWAWAPDGDGCLTQRRGGVEFTRGNETIELARRDSATQLFSAPVYSSDDKEAYYIASDESGEAVIFALDIQRLTPRKLSPVSGHCRMVLSPEGHYLAFVQAEGRRLSGIGKAHLIDLETGNESTPVDFDVSAIFFSTDGKKWHYSRRPKRSRPAPCCPAASHRKSIEHLARGEEEDPERCPLGGEDLWIPDTSGGFTT